MSNEWDLSKVVNDTRHSAEDVMAALKKDGLTLKYGKIHLMVATKDFARAQEQVALIPSDRRQPTMVSVDSALRKNARKINRARADKKVFDDFYADLMIWEALKRLGGAQ